MQNIQVSLFLVCFFALISYAGAQDESRGDFFGIASYYDDDFHGRKTASGEIYDKNKYTAAHKDLPFGSKIRVYRMGTGQHVDVTVNDRGPYLKGRVVDLSRKAAEAIGLTKVGTTQVEVKVLKRGDGKRITSSSSSSSATASRKVKPSTTPTTTPTTAYEAPSRRIPSVSNTPKSNYVNKLSNNPPSSGKVGLIKSFRNPTTGNTVQRPNDFEIVRIIPGEQMAPKSPGSYYTGSSPVRPLTQYGNQGNESIGTIRNYEFEDKSSLVRFPRQSVVPSNQNRIQPLNPYGSAGSRVLVSGSRPNMYVLPIPSQNVSAFGLYEIQVERAPQQGFAVQVAYLSNYINTLNQIANLQSKARFNVLLSVEPANTPDGSAYRVMIGPFTNESQANRAQQDLRRNFRLEGFTVNLSGL